MLQVEGVVLATVLCGILTVALIVWLHFYLLPQYLIGSVQSLFDEREVVFFSRTWAEYRGSENPMVALTIDDAPTEDTGDILDILKRYDVKATFFIISSFIPGKEHFLDRMIAEGHEVANHTTEDTASWKMSRDVFEGSLLSCEGAIRRWIDSKKPKWFRPGHGVFTTTMRETLKRHGYRIALGNAFPNDAQPTGRKFQSSNPTLNAWYLRNRCRAGGIMIVHDRPWTVDTLEKCLESLTDRFRVRTLSTLFEELPVPVLIGQETKS